MSMRTDVDSETLLMYIFTFYRVLEPEFLCRNLKTMAKADIINMHAAKVTRLQVTENNPNLAKKGAAIPFDYQKAKEESAVNRPQAGRLLACLILSKSYSEQYLPYDPFEARHFFKENFKCTESDALDKYCLCRDVKKEELLSYYRNIAETNRVKSLTVYKEPKRTSTSDLLIATFLQLTK